MVKNLNVRLSPRIKIKNLNNIKKKISINIIF